MDSKIRIRMGDVEVEYEGSEEFLKQELPAILDAVSKLHDTRASSTGAARAGAAGEASPRNHHSGAGTTKAVAAKLVAQSGGDLMLAAAVKLTVVDGVVSHGLSPSVRRGLSPG